MNIQRRLPSRSLTSPSPHYHLEWIVISAYIWMNKTGGDDIPGFAQGTMEDAPCHL